MNSVFQLNNNYYEVSVVEVVESPVFNSENAFLTLPGFLGGEKFLRVTKGICPIVTIYDRFYNFVREFRYQSSSIYPEKYSLEVLTEKLIIFLFSKGINCFELTNDRYKEITIAIDRVNNLFSIIIDGNECFTSHSVNLQFFEQNCELVSEKDVETSDEAIEYTERKYKIK